MRVVILQPGYLPWLGFFDQMAAADIFVYYDDVQYDKHGWRNRNRIKTTSGPQWLSVPVRWKGLGWPSIKEVTIDNRSSWARKHRQSLKTNYSKARFFDYLFPDLERLLLQEWRWLLELDVAATAVLLNKLGLKRNILFASDLDVVGEKSERLLNICLALGAKTYLSGAAARDYLDISLFQRHGLQVEFQDYRHPVYPQLFGDFVSHLSVVDLIFNCGPQSLAILTNSSARPRP